MAECGDPDAKLAMKKILQDRSREKHFGRDEPEHTI